MKLLFISQAARIIYDDAGNAYLNHHMNYKTIRRFASCCDELTMFLRDSGIRLPERDARAQYNPFPHDLARLIVGYNPYRPLTNWLKINERIKLRQQMEEAICAADRVIFAAPSGFYIDMGIPLCVRHQKRYMLMNGGFTFETTWNNTNPLGKVMAPLCEYRSKRNQRRADWVLYVTEWALQKRYPCGGHTAGCSDVEVPGLAAAVLEARLQRIAASADAKPAQETAAGPETAARKGQKPLSVSSAQPSGTEQPGLEAAALKGQRPLRADSKLVLGTAAGLEDALKGQRYVIQALAKLKAQGISGIEYQLIGGGSPERLLAEARRFGVEDQVHILGMKPHEEVYAWLDQIDVYIQPSFSEGLCRAIVEAMSRACPVLSSDAGGNVELCGEEFLFKAGHVDQIVARILRIRDAAVMERAARENFARAEKYETARLDEIRNQFLTAFMQPSSKE